MQCWLHVAELSVWIGVTMRCTTAGTSEHRRSHAVTERHLLDERPHLASDIPGARQQLANVEVFITLKGQQITLKGQQSMVRNAALLTS